MEVTCCGIQEIRERHVLEVRVDHSCGPVALGDSRGEVVANDGGRLGEAIIDSAEKSRGVRSFDDGVVIELRLFCLGDFDSRVEASDISVHDVVPNDSVVMGEGGISIWIVRVLPFASALAESESNATPAIDDGIVLDQCAARAFPEMNGMFGEARIAINAPEGVVPDLPIPT